MSKEWKPRKSTVELEGEPRPSRIRRDPQLADTRENLGRDAWWESRDWEIRFAIAGVILFSLAIWLISIGFSEVTSH